MRYLGNDTSIVRDADIDATNGLPSEAIYRTDTAAKVGGGSVELDGPYTGAADTTIDVEVVDNGGSTIQVSQPSFVGVGSGDMAAVSAPGVAVQSVVVTLEDLGTETLAAYSTFQGITLRAIASGAGGNDITIDVDHTALVSSDTEWSLQSDLSEGTNEYVGEQWDFGAAILEPAGTIPATAPLNRNTLTSNPGLEMPTASAATSASRIASSASSRETSWVRALAAMTRSWAVFMMVLPVVWIGGLGIWRPGMGSPKMFRPSY